MLTVFTRLSAFPELTPHLNPKNVIHLLPFIKEQSMFIRVNDIINKLHYKLHY